MRTRLIVGLGICVVTNGEPSGPDLRYFAGDDHADTAVTIQGDQFVINGLPTYSGAAIAAEGRLLNVRMAQAVIDDFDEDIHPEWHDCAATGKVENDFLRAGLWSPRRHTARLIAALPAWRTHGVLAFTVSLQGGCQCGLGVVGPDQTGVLDFNPFGVQGTQCFDHWRGNVDSPQARTLARLGSLIRAADDWGMVIILTAFYFGQEDSLADEDAVIAALDGLVAWIVENGFTNVLLEIANESADSPIFSHEILYESQIPVLLDRVRELTDKDGVGDSTGFADNPGFLFPAGHLLTSVSSPGGLTPPASWLTRVDYVLLHGNQQLPTGITAMVDTVRVELFSLFGDAEALPIVFNEDDGRFQTGPELGFRTLNLEAAFDAGASWGLYFDHYHQSIYPPRFAPWGNAAVVADAMFELSQGPGQQPNQTPVPVIEGPSEVVIGTVPRFESSLSSDPDQFPHQNLHASWRINGGDPWFGPVFEPSFLTIGLHEIELNVHDGQDIASTTHSFSVTGDALIADPLTGFAVGPWQGFPEHRIRRTLAGVELQAGAEWLLPGDVFLLEERSNVEIRCQFQLDGAQSRAGFRLGPPSCLSGDALWIELDGLRRLTVHKGNAKQRAAQFTPDSTQQSVELRLRIMGSNLRVECGTAVIELPSASMPGANVAVVCHLGSATVKHFSIRSLAANGMNSDGG